MTRRRLATGQTDLKLSCQCDRGLLRIWLCAVAAQPVVPAHDAFWMCAAARANQRPTTTISEPTMESPAGLAIASARAHAARTPTTWPSFSSRGGVGHRKASRGARRGCDGHRCRGRWSAPKRPRRGKVLRTRGPREAVSLRGGCGGPCLLFLCLEATDISAPQRARSESQLDEVFASPMASSESALSPSHQFHMQQCLPEGFRARRVPAGTCFLAMGASGA